MDETPLTRNTLLTRLREADDQEAWREFVEIYEPLIYRSIRSKGLQHADAQELTQEALLAVAEAIGSGDYEHGKGTFRGWLFRIARNMTINFLTRARPAQRGVGGTDFVRLLREQPDSSGEELRQFDRDHEREVFHWAARRIRGEFQESTWRAFWKTGVEGVAIEEAARELGLSVGAIYAARSRVMARLRRVIERWQSGSAEIDEREQGESQ